VVLFIKNPTVLSHPEHVEFSFILRLTEEEETHPISGPGFANVGAGKAH